MASNNVETLRAAHESWNKRDFQGVIRNAAEGLVYTDHSRNLAPITRDKFRDGSLGHGFHGRPHHQPRIH